MRERRAVEGDEGVEDPLQRVVTPNKVKISPLR
jgi:hypothetical protein